LNNENSNRSPLQIAWHKFRKNRLALFGLLVLTGACIVAILGSTIRPDASPDANDQHLSLAKKPINFKVEMLAVQKNAEIDKGLFFSRFFFGGKESVYNSVPVASYRFINDTIQVVKYSDFEGDLKETLSLSMLDVCYPIQPETYRLQGDVMYARGIDGKEISMTVSSARNLIEKEHIYTKRFLLGTDKFGRDLLSRLMAGTIVSLSVGLISVFISLLLGISLGSLAGYFGGWIDEVITWLINVVWSIPTLLLVIAITFALGKGFVQVFIAVGLTMWVEVARVIRGQVLGLKNLEYVQAARALGFPNRRIIFRHILPNALGPVIVISAANFASAILLEAGLSFLGIGAQIPMASWGQMINEHYIYITTSRAHLAIFPGICILILVLAFMLIGNGLRDSFDTRNA
jgi:peptide/nickel transport system permease protein